MSLQVEPRLQRIKAARLAVRSTLPVGVALRRAMVDLDHLDMNLPIPIQTVPLLHKLRVARTLPVLLVLPVDKLQLDRQSPQLH